jgi:SAM-dependent methyltransferase
MALASAPAPSLAGSSFVTVTELPGSRASREQLDMAVTRYRLAAELAEGRDVLEVACGSGMGLGMPARRARTLVGGDFDPKLVEVARRQYGDRIDIRRLDAQALPFPKASFDMLLMLEAIYYLPDAARFIAEARRVLRPGGVLFLCSANREWPGFNPSPFSHRYYSLRELGDLLRDAGFEPELRVGFPAGGGGWKSSVIGLIRKTAVKLRLIPNTMEGKERLKRLFYGRLQPLPNELTDIDGEFHPPVAHSGTGPVNNWKVLYAIGRLPDPH